MLSSISPVAQFWSSIVVMIIACASGFFLMLRVPTLSNKAFIGLMILLIVLSFVSLIASAEIIWPGWTEIVAIFAVIGLCLLACILLVSFSNKWAYRED